MAGIYLHIPYCSKACHYCDFHFSTNLSTKDALIDCLLHELKIRSNYLEGEEVTTIYFGGGTPSVLSAREIELILSTIHREFNTKVKETTLEANPEDLGIEYLKSLKTIGIDRLSIGIQSFDNSLLQKINRSHTSKQAHDSVYLAAEAGFENVSIDLIYGLPSSTLQTWKKDVTEALKLPIKHLSVYQLTIEPNTAFGRWSETGRFREEDETNILNQYELLKSLTEKSGFDHYEISNFSLPGFHSKHNSSYWQGHKYLGIGPGAHSFNRKTRSFNVSNNNSYIQSLQGGTLPTKEETLTRKDQINEYVMTRLRTSQGCDLNEMKNQFDYDLLLESEKILLELRKNGWLEDTDNHLILTEKGKLFADKIASELFIN